MDVEVGFELVGVAMFTHIQHPTRKTNQTMDRVHNERHKEGKPIHRFCFCFTVNVDLCEQSQNTNSNMEQYVASTSKPISLKENLNP